MISTRLPAQYDAAVTLLTELQELAQREDQARPLRRPVWPAAHGHHMQR
jgi:hypothetical protein